MCALALFSTSVLAQNAGTLEFSATLNGGNVALYGGSESAGTVAVTITRSGGSGTVWVTLATSNGSALAGSDYTSVNTIVVFPGSGFATTATSQTVLIPIVDDGVGENQESLNLTLSSPAGGAVLGARSTAILRIADDDPPVAPMLSVGPSPNPKQLQLNWTSTPGATSITPSYSAHLRSSFTPFGNTLSGGATMARHDIGVHRYAWRSGPRYRVEVCNAYGCVTSNIAALPTPQNAMLDAIGYIKSSTTGPQEFFGGKLALSADGRTLATSTLGGAVHIFTRSVFGGWSQQVALPGQTASVTGLAMSADGNTLAVAHHDFVDVFVRTASMWSMQESFALVDEDPNWDDHVAVALSDDGDTLAIGVTYDAGAVHVFVRSTTSWSLQAIINASNAGCINASNADCRGGLGWSLALSGDGSTLAAGAPFEWSTVSGVNGYPSSGAAYVFTRAGSQWSQQAHVTASNRNSHDHFGWAVSLDASGDTLAVGAPNEQSAALGVNGDQNDNSAHDAGAAYVFARSASQWSQQAYLKAVNTRPFDYFGGKLMLSGDGDLLVIGAPGEDGTVAGVAIPQTTGLPPIETDDGLLQHSGAAHTYERTGTPATWRHDKYIKAPNPGTDDAFGSNVALSDDGATLAISAALEESAATGIDGDQLDNSADNAGAVYLY